MMDASGTFLSTATMVRSGAWKFRRAIWADAKDRLKAIPWAQYRGEVFATVRIPRTLWRGLWGRITACFGNVST